MLPRQEVALCRHVWDTTAPRQAAVAATCSLRRPRPAGYAVSAAGRRPRGV